MQQYVDNDLAIPQTIIKEKVKRTVKSYNDNLMVVEVNFSNNAIGEVHVHQQEQITYCLEGTFDYSIEDKVYRMEKGDTIYVPTNIKHGCVLISEKGTLLDIFTPSRKDFIN